MKIVIVGGVAAGTSVATKARRNDPHCQTVIFERGAAISYAACGIPYLFGSSYEIAVKDLMPRDVAWFQQRGVDIRPFHEVTAVDLVNKEVRVVNLQTGTSFNESFDVLVLATGSKPKIPHHLQSLSQLKNVATIKDPLAAATLKENYKKGEAVAIIGAGYIGLEMAEQLTEAGMKVSLIQHSAHPMSMLSETLGSDIIETLERHHVAFYANQEVSSYQEEQSQVRQLQLSDGTILPVDQVILATGAVPETTLAQKIGVRLGQTGAIAVDEHLQTNLKDVYAVGDCIELKSRITNEAVYLPLATNANRCGRLLGDYLTGGKITLSPVLGTAITKCFDLEIGMTGASKRELEKWRIPFIEVDMYTPAKSSYIDKRPLHLHAYLHPQRYLLGVAITGQAGVDKRIDVLATAMTARMTVDQLAQLDLGYEPLFSTSRDAIIQLALVASHRLDKFNNDNGSMDGLD